jgi:hypothetical protein
VSPDYIQAWIGVVAGGAGLLAVAFRFARKAFRAFDRLEGAVSAIETRSEQLEHNGGASLRDDARAAREAAESTQAALERVESRLDRHLELHAATPVPARRRS